MESEEIEKAKKIRELMLKRFGSKSKEYLDANRRVSNARGNKWHTASKEVSKFKRKLLPLLTALFKKERGKMLKDEEKELKRAIRPYVVEAVINDTYEMDMEALIDITRDKINAEKVSG